MARTTLNLNFQCYSLNNDVFVEALCIDEDLKTSANPVLFENCFLCDIVQYTIYYIVIVIIAVH